MRRAALRSESIGQLKISDLDSDSYEITGNSDDSSIWNESSDYDVPNYVNKKRSSLKRFGSALHASYIKMTKESDYETLPKLRDNWSRKSFTKPFNRSKSGVTSHSPGVTSHSPGATSHYPLSSTPIQKKTSQRSFVRTSCQQIQHITPNTPYVTLTSNKSQTCQRTDALAPESHYEIPDELLLSISESEPFSMNECPMLPSSSSVRYSTSSTSHSSNPENYRPPNNILTPEIEDFIFSDHNRKRKVRSTSETRGRLPEVPLDHQSSFLDMCFNNVSLPGMSLVSKAFPDCRNIT